MRNFNSFLQGDVLQQAKEKKDYNFFDQEIKTIYERREIYTQQNQIISLEPQAPRSRNDGNTGKAK